MEDGMTEGYINSPFRASRSPHQLLSPSLWELKEQWEIPNVDFAWGDQKRRKGCACAEIDIRFGHVSALRCDQ